MISSTSLIGSEKCISKTREYITPLLPKKGCSVARLLFHKFKTDATFTAKLVTLYLLNDMLAYGKNTYPGVYISSTSSKGFAVCIAPYIELMIGDIRNCSDCSSHRIEQLIELWRTHSMFHSFNPLTP